MPKKREPAKEGVGFGLGLGGLLKGLGSIFDLISQMTEEGLSEVTRMGEIEGLGKGIKGMYGFTVKTGLGGSPEISSFGNIRATEKGAVVEEVREPIVDVFDEEDKVLVVAELPGVQESDIQVQVEGDILTLSAETSDRKYAKEVLLPRRVDAATMRSSYNNGILELVFPKDGK